MGLAGRSDLASDCPEKTPSLLLGRQGKKAGEHTGGVGVENGGVTVEGEAQHRARCVRADTRERGELFKTVGKATAVFHDHTAAGKLKAEITATTPSGCQVSISRWPGRSDGIVRPSSWRESPTAKSQTSIIS